MLGQAHLEPGRLSARLSEYCGQGPRLLELLPPYLCRRAMKSYPSFLLQGWGRKLSKDTSSFHGRGEIEKTDGKEEERRTESGEKREKAKLSFICRASALAKYHL